MPAYLKAQRIQHGNHIRLAWSYVATGKVRFGREEHIAHGFCGQTAIV